MKWQKLKMPSNITVAPAKFVIFNVISFGFYSIYWAWRVWETVRRSRKEVYNFKSSLRAFFMTFSNFLLFPQITELAEGKGYKLNTNPKLLAAIFFVTTIVGNANATPVSLWVVTLFASTFALLPIVKMHNHYVVTTKGRYTPSTANYPLLITLIVVGFFVAASSYIQPSE
jgi:hypothetical protein